MDENEILEERKKLLDEKLKLLDVRTQLVGEAVFRDAQKRLAAWVGSALAVITAVFGIVTFFGLDYALDRYVDRQVGKQVKDEVDGRMAEVENARERAEGIIDELVGASDKGRIAVGVMQGSLRTTEEAVARVSQRNAELERATERGQLVSELFVKSLIAMQTDSMFCTPNFRGDEARLFNPEIRLKFSAPYRVGDSTYDSFRLPDPRNRFRIYSDPEVLKLGNGTAQQECLWIFGDMELTNSATPAFADLRQLPNLEGFYVDQIRIESGDEDGEQEETAFRAHWGKIDAVRVLLEIGSTNAFFTRNPDFFFEAEWLEEDARYLLLDPVQFVEETTDPSTNDAGGASVLRAFFPLREPVSLSALVD